MNDRSTATTSSAYIDATPPAEDAARVEAATAPFAEMLGRVPDGLRLLGVSPALLEGYVENIHYFMGHPRLGQALTTMIRYLVSSAGDCRYCIDLNEGMLVAAGFELEAVRRARQDPAQAPLPERERALLTLVLHAVANPHGMEPTEFAAVRAFGWSDQDIFDAVYHGVFNRAFGNLLEAFNVHHDGSLV
ncbi:MAG: hypothetical protein PVF51_14500 [Nitrospirota bacterium]|jgi:alkylhydroperoxidase family enzyme